MEAETFTVTTWNVLAAAFAFPDRYEHVRAELLSSGSRFPLVCARVRAMLDDNDAVVLQEVEPPLWLMLREWLGERAATALFARHATRPDGVALLSRHQSRHHVEGDVLQRGFAMATFDVRHHVVHTATTHLSHRETPLRPGTIMDAILDALPEGPAILALDANASWMSAVCEPARRRGWLSSTTEPSGFWAGEWLDTDLIAVRDAKVRCERGAMVPDPPNESWPSDHLPITGVVTLS